MAGLTIGHVLDGAGLRPRRLHLSRSAPHLPSRSPPRRARNRHGFAALGLYCCLSVGGKMSSAKGEGAVKGARSESTSAPCRARRCGPLSAGASRCTRSHGVPAGGGNGVQRAGRPAGSRRGGDSCSPRRSFWPTPTSSSEPTTGRSGSPARLRPAPSSCSTRASGSAMSSTVPAGRGAVREGRGWGRGPGLRTGRDLGGGQGRRSAGLHRPRARAVPLAPGRGAATASVARGSRSIGLGPATGPRLASLAFARSGPGPSRRPASRPPERRPRPGPLPVR